MASRKCALIIVSLCTVASTFAKETQIIGVDGHTLTLKTKSWSRPVAESATALFTAKDKAFSLYVADVGVDTDDGWLSPDKKTLLVSQAIYGSVVGQDGEVFNAGGAAGSGSGTGIGILVPDLPLIADQARAGNTLKAGTANSEKFDEQIRFVTGLGKPIKSVKAAVIVPSSVAPKISKSNADGLHPRIETDTAETAEIHLM